MPSGSFSKRARNTDSVVNRKNCGGNKKAGLAPRATGPVEFRNVAFDTHPTVNNKVHQGGLPCPENYSNNPGGQCSGGVSPRSVTRGCGNLTIRFDISGNNNNRYTRISSNPTVEVLVEGELNAAKLAQIAVANNHDGFKNPTEIIIGTGVTAINGDLLNGAVNAKRLQTFGFKAGSGHRCESIGVTAFNFCENLTSVNIPNSVISIGTAAFQSCSSLESVKIPNKLRSIGNAAFYQCSSLESVVIGNSVTSIGNFAFGFCSSLASVNIPDSVTTIGGFAFFSCSSLTSVVFKANINTSIRTTSFHETQVSSVAGFGDGYSSTTHLGELTSFAHNSDVTFST